MSEIQTYTPSNGAMLVCSSGGDYIKTKDHLATIARLEAEKAQKQLIIDDCKRNLKEQDATIARLTRELEEARRWVNDLQSGMYINCVYCGHRYGPKDKVPCTMADALKQHIEQCPKHPMSSLRAELADLKDGLTAAHMDGFASGKAEATEMLRKREGQLEELRAEVKAYREVEDSLQKEIKRLDEEVERLRNEGGTMRVINQSGGKPPSSVCSAPAEGARSNVFPMYPCWPPAELPLHVRVLPQVGGPHPSVHDSEDDY